MNQPVQMPRIVSQKRHQIAYMAIKMHIKITHPAIVHTRVTSPTVDINWQYIHIYIRINPIIISISQYDSMSKEVKA
jgi:hypothetical protein